MGNKSKKYAYRVLRKLKYDINRVRMGKFRKIYNPHEIVLNWIKIKNRHVFAGYYDKNPYSKADNKILFVTCDINLKDNKIGYYDLLENKIKIICKTEVNNWQMGPRLFWYKKGHIFFNNFSNDKYTSQIMDLEGNVVKRFEFSLYEISNNREIGIGLDFILLHLLREGYGYDNLNTNIEDYYNNSKNSIELYDMNTSKVINSLKMTEVLTQFPVVDEEDYYHYFNHISYSTDDKHFIFFHLWKNKKTGQLFNRLLIANNKLEIVYVLEEGNQVSHYTWRNSEELLITTYEDGKCKYKLYRFDYANKSYKIEYLSGLFGDGHPSYINEDVIISDTYPDKTSYQTLFMYNTKTKEKTNLMEIYSDPKQFNVKRCDLHPKTSLDSDLISFDSTHLGFRAIGYFSSSEINID